MNYLVASGTVVASPGLAHAVHVEIEGVAPDRWYWYRFHAAGETSPVGRARTMPAAEQEPERLRLAFASCQHFEYGYYTAYEHMAREELDLVLHLGDYIYEYGASAKSVRKHVGDKECDSLDDYRNRYAQYKSDKLLQAAHAHCPWIVTPDDHEVQNDYAGSHSEKAGTDPKAFLARRAQAYQAYFEHMPLRRAGPRAPTCCFIAVSSSALANFFVLDERQYRTPQPCGNGNKPPCAGTFDPAGTLLGSRQEAWLREGLSASTTRWNALAQQVMMARVDRALGADVAYSMDQWPGYEANRRRMLDFFASSNVANPVVLTGDIHSNYANDLQVDSSRPDSAVVASEFVGTSISSGGDGAQQHKKTSEMLAENPFVKFFNAERGYVSCEVTPERWTTHYRTVEFVTRPGAPLSTRKSFVPRVGPTGHAAGVTRPPYKPEAPAKTGAAVDDRASRRYFASASGLCG